MSSEKKNEDCIVLERFQPLHLILNTPKGRGVFTPTPISAGHIIDISPVLILSPTENATHIEHTSLYHYTYNWPLPPASAPNTRPNKTQAVVLGLGSLFNHSSQKQNVGWQRDLEREVIVYRALRDIGAGEELCISYGDRLTFVDADADADAEGDAEGEGSGEEMLGRIVVDGE